MSFFPSNYIKTQWSRKEMTREKVDPMNGEK